MGAVPTFPQSCKFSWLLSHLSRPRRVVPWVLVNRQMIVCLHDKCFTKRATSPLPEHLQRKHVMGKYKTRGLPLIFIFIMFSTKWDKSQELYTQGICKPSNNNSSLLFLCPYPVVQDTVWRVIWVLSNCTLFLLGNVIYSHCNYSVRFDYENAGKKGKNLHRYYVQVNNSAAILFFLF